MDSLESNSIRPAILVVDDTPEHLVSMELALRPLGAEIIMASSGLEALSWLLRKRFAMILLDVQMPDMDGFKTAELIHQYEAFRDIPIIFMTSIDNEAKYPLKEYVAGAVDCLLKPIDADVLKSKVLVLLQPHREKEDLSTLIKSKEKLLTENEIHLVEKESFLSEIDLKDKKIKKISKICKALAVVVFITLILPILISYYHNSTLIRAYDRFVPHEFLNLLGKKSIIDVHLGDETLRKMTVMFTDVRDYTSISEKMSPQENIDFVNGVFGCANPSIRHNHGFINQFLGDGIMALFPDEIDDAVDGAIELLQNLREYSKSQVAERKVPIRMGIGIDTGVVMVGTVGQEDRMEHAVKADLVNVASRVESLTKYYGLSLLITERVYQGLKNPSKYQIYQVDTVQLKGKTEPVTIYHILEAEDAEKSALLKKVIDDFTYGIELFRSRNFTGAKVVFQKVLDISKESLIAKSYLDRCDKLIQNPPAEDWSFVNVFETK
ncbi:MAG: response regulator [Chlamydiae bacterium]|nr:response regulator [Chlamydiota bacterium]